VTGSPVRIQPTRPPVGGRTDNRWEFDMASIDHAPFRVEAVDAREILDSRGRPTVAVDVRIGDHRGSAAVPSGASTGEAEAVERRDGDASRFRGAGVLEAVRSVTGEIATLLRGSDFVDLAAADEALRRLDGTPTKARLGANAIVGASMALARALASRADMPLYAYLRPDGVTPRLPVPHFNVLNGGAHATNRVEFQEFMIAPVGAPTVADAVRAGAEIYGALKARLADAGLATGVGDEGGFAPDLDTPEQACDHLVAAIEAAGYEPSRVGVALALDPAATQFYSDGRYHLGGQHLTAAELTDRYAAMIERYPIWSLEDGVAENDADGWTLLSGRLAGSVQIMGDDNLVTDPARIAAAAERHQGNASLIKLNQIGTVTETLAAIAACRTAGWAAMISHRSGETTDDFIADLAVGTGTGQIKSGAPARGERVAKYNRLMRIATDEPTFAYGLAGG
jgi:enolase